MKSFGVGNVWPTIERHNLIRPTVMKSSEIGLSLHARTDTWQHNRHSNQDGLVTKAASIILMQKLWNMHILKTFEFISIDTLRAAMDQHNTQLGTSVLPVFMLCKQWNTMLQDPMPALLLSKKLVFTTLQTHHDSRVKQQ